MNVVGVCAGLKSGHSVEGIQQDIAELPSPLDEDMVLLLVLLLGDDLDPHRELVDHEVHVGLE